MTSKPEQKPLFSKEEKSLMKVQVAVTIATALYFHKVGFKKGYNHGYNSGAAATLMKLAFKTAL